jgi:hypothetical protein
MMVRLEGQPAGTASAAPSGMRAAAAEAAGKLGRQGRWFQGLLSLAAERAGAQEEAQEKEEESS